MDIGGKELVIKPASFASAMKLKYQIGKVLDIKDIDISSVEIDPENPLQSNVGSKTIGSLIENIITVATDPKIMDCLFECCGKGVLLDKDLVNKEFFENPDNREYYYPVMIEVLKVNITPFFGKVSSMFSGVGGLMEKLQAQK